VTLFEYLAIAYSLVLSFAVLRAASGVPHALASGRRYWVHAAWTLLILAVCLTVFWAFWSYREVEWTLWRFVLVLCNPIVIFIAASIVVPPEPAEIRSWREYFYAVRVKLFVSGICYVVVMSANHTFVLDMSLWHPYRAFYLACLAIYSVGVLSNRPDVHAALIVLNLLLLLTFLLAPWSAPGGLAASPSPAYYPTGLPPVHGSVSAWPSTRSATWVSSSEAWP
jgi:hypothetical protein